MVFFPDDTHAETEQLKAKGVEFVSESAEAGGATIAVFDDTRNNLIQLIAGVADREPEALHKESRPPLLTRRGGRVDTLRHTTQRTALSRSAQ